MDEEKLQTILDASGAFDLVKDARFRIYSYRDFGISIEIDAVCQKGRTVFVFECSRGPPDISQLKERFLLFRINRITLVNNNVFLPYNSIRVFYCNLKSQRLVEFDEKGRILKTSSYRNVGDLIEILRKL